jgi:SAM-dependent methyltransferase
MTPLEARVQSVVEESDFYEKTYSTVRSDVQTRVRNETYDEDLGQAGWLQAAEAHEFASWLGSGVTSVLDVACGSGGISALLAQDLGAEVTGIDVDPHAVAAANERGAAGCSFQLLDANERLLFADRSFDVVFSNDSVHQLRDRPAVLRDWARVLRPEGQVLFTEGLVLTGPVSNEEVRRRTFMGFFMVTPPGANERAIEATGLVLERAEDRSGAVADVGARMRAARERYRDEMIAVEGAETFEAFQDFLDVAVSLAGERRLSRWVFHARKPSGTAS